MVELLRFLKQENLIRDERREEIGKLKIASPWLWLLITQHTRWNRARFISKLPIFAEIKQRKIEEIYWQGSSKKCQLKRSLKHLADLKKYSYMFSLRIPILKPF